MLPWDNQRNAWSRIKTSHSAEAHCEPLQLPGDNNDDDCNAKDKTRYDDWWGVIIVMKPGSG